MLQNGIYYILPAPSGHCPLEGFDSEDAKRKAARKELVFISTLISTVAGKDDIIESTYAQKISQVTQVLQ